MRLPTLRQVERRGSWLLSRPVYVVMPQLVRVQSAAACHQWCDWPVAWTPVLELMGNTSSTCFTTLCNRRQNLRAYQISKWSVNLRLIYNYSRFLKTIGRHIGFLLPVLILTISSSSACDSLSAYHPNQTIRVWYMTSSRFSRWRPSAIGFDVGKW